MNPAPPAYARVTGAGWWSVRIDGQFFTAYANGWPQALASAAQRHDVAPAAGRTVIIERCPPPPRARRRNPPRWLDLAIDPAKNSA